jgi:hypothetical protein
MMMKPKEDDMGAPSRVAGMGERIHEYRILVRIPEGKR